MAIDKAIAKAILGNGKKALKKSANLINGKNGKNGLNGNGNGNGYKNGVPKGVKLKPEPLTEGNLARSKFVKEQLDKRTTYKGQELSAPVSSAHYAHEFWNMPGQLSKQTQVRAALTAKGFRFTSSPIRSKSGKDISKLGYNQNLLSIAHNERRLGDDEFINPAILQNKVDEVLGEEQRFFRGQEYKIQSGGGGKPHAIAANPNQRALGVATMKSRNASKKGNAGVRSVHPETKEYKDMKKLRARLNEEATERAKAAGTHIDKHQYVTVEHNARLSANPLFNKVNEGGIGKRGNEKWNIYIQTNEDARWFKDAMEIWFYSNQGTKLRGNNWYLINDLSNKKDLKIMEVSTGRTIGVIPMPDDYKRGVNIQEQFNEALRLLYYHAEGFHMTPR